MFKNWLQTSSQCETRSSCVKCHLITAMHILAERLQIKKYDKSRLSNTLHGLTSTWDDCSEVNKTHKGSGMLFSLCLRRDLLERGRLFSLCNLSPENVTDMSVLGSERFVMLKQAIIYDFYKRLPAPCWVKFNIIIIT